MRTSLHPLPPSQRRAGRAGQAPLQEMGAGGAADAEAPLPSGEDIFIASRITAQDTALREQLKAAADCLFVSRAPSAVGAGLGDGALPPAAASEGASMEDSLRGGSEALAAIADAAAAGPAVGEGAAAGGGAGGGRDIGVVISPLVVIRLSKGGGAFLPAPPR
jgi:hypothetical protein